MWMVLSVLYMVVRPFVTRPIPFNSMVTAYVSIPLISDDVQWVSSIFSSYNHNKKNKKLLLNFLQTFSKIWTEIGILLFTFIFFQELSYYPSLWLAIHNVSVITALFFLYTILCIYVLKTSRGAKLGLERTQIQVKSDFLNLQKLKQKMF